MIFLLLLVSLPNLAFADASYALVLTHLGKYVSIVFIFLSLILSILFMILYRKNKTGNMKFVFSFSTVSLFVFIALYLVLSVLYNYALRDESNRLKHELDQSHCRPPGSGNCPQ